MLHVAIVLDLLFGGHGRQGNVRVDRHFAFVAVVILGLALPPQLCTRRRVGIFRFFSFGTRLLIPQ